MIIESSSIKTIWYISWMGIFAYLNMQEMQVFILTVFMVMDIITWILKQWWIDRTKISSEKLTRWIIKKILTIMFLFSFALMFKWIWIDGGAYITSVLSLLIMSEFYSNTQNIYCFRTWKTVEEYDVISLIIKYIWDQLIKIIEKHIWKKQ